MAYDIDNKALKLHRAKMEEIKKETKGYIGVGGNRVQLKQNYNPEAYASPRDRKYDTKNTDYVPGKKGSKKK